MHYIYAPEFNGQKDSIPEEELHHLRVKRIRDGEIFGILNGRGRITYVYFMEGMIFQKGVEDVPAPDDVFICSPIPQGKRGSLLVEKLSEIGIKGFVPLITERSRRKVNISKLEKHVIAGMKQSGNPWKMAVYPPMNLQDVVREFSGHSLYFGDREGEKPEMGIRGVFIVGPEGGLSENEKGFLLKNGVRPLSIGRNILRVETAAMGFALLSML